MQEEIAKQPWENQFETVLGTDRYGARYIYFPQFLKTDLRIYRHSLDNKIYSTVKVPASEVNYSLYSLLIYIFFLINNVFILAHQVKAAYKHRK